MLQMDRKQRGLLLIATGVVLFAISLVMLLYFGDFYLIALAIMFVSVVFIGLGTALAKGIDASIEIPRDDCYYCSGTGKIESEGEQTTCPRCGGTGLAREDD